MRLNRERVIAFLLPAGTFVVLAATWQLWAMQSENPLIATFTETIDGFFTVVTGSEFWSAFVNSNQALVIGYVLAVVTAIPLGLAAGRSKTIDRMSEPYVAIALAIPIAPLIPVVIVALGLGLASRVVIVYFFVFIFISVNTRAGVRQVEKSLIEMARSFGASESEIWRLVIVPGASPAIFAGLRIGLGRAVTGMVVVELLLVASGFGRLLLQYDGRLEGGLLYGLVVAVILEMLILLNIMQYVERRSTSWVSHVHG